jgi:hypothetical protein
VLSPIKVTSVLPVFVEMAFLRSEKFDVQDALHRSFDRVDLLTHTSVILFHREELGAVKVDQFVRTNQDCPWGLDLPKCPTCDVSLWVSATMLNDNSDQCRLRCRRCTSFASHIRRPYFVQVCNKRYLQDRFFILPFPAPPRPWENAVWTRREFSK